MSDLHFLPIDQHAIQLFNGSIGCFGSLVVDVTISLGETGLAVGDNLAGKNVSKQTEGVVQLLVVDRLVEVLDKDVSNTRSTKRWITLAPHDAAGLVLDHGEVHGVKSALGITHLVVVHIGVTKGTTSDGITANTDGGNGSNGVENLEQKTFVGIGGKITDVQRCRMEGRRSFASGRPSLSRNGGGSRLWGRGRDGFGGGRSCSRHGDFQRRGNVYFFIFFFFFFSVSKVERVDGPRERRAKADG
mmetsp:Transcript_26446/g.61954  ORF Transcript_26446/g.61954 Transcript_26446/m.61954 type:complete len:245 (-) Transcript_26446:28-762(-)